MTHLIGIWVICSSGLLSRLWSLLVSFLLSSLRGHLAGCMVSEHLTSQQKNWEFSRVVPCQILISTVWKFQLFTIDHAANGVLMCLLFCLFAVSMGCDFFQVKFSSWNIGYRSLSLSPLCLSLYWSVYHLSDIFWDMVLLYNPGWSQICLILLSQPSECQDYKYMPLHPARGIENDRRKKFSKEDLSDPIFVCVCAVINWSCIRHCQLFQFSLLLLFICSWISEFL